MLLGGDVVRINFGGSDPLDIVIIRRRGNGLSVGLGHNREHLRTIVNTVTRKGAFRAIPYIVIGSSIDRRSLATSLILDGGNSPLSPCTATIIYGHVAH